MALVGLTGFGQVDAHRPDDAPVRRDGRVDQLDGVDIRDLTRYDLRKHIAMAFEDATLFSASVRENVLLGRPEGSEERARRGARDRAVRVRLRPS